MILAAAGERSAPRAALVRRPPGNASGLGGLRAVDVAPAPGLPLASLVRSVLEQFYPRWTLISFSSTVEAILTFSSHATVEMKALGKI